MRTKSGYSTAQVKKKKICQILNEFQYNTEQR